MRIERMPSLVLLAQGALYVFGAAAAVGVGVDIGLRLAEPETVTKYRTLEVLPACREIDAAVQHERALTEKLDAANTTVQELTAGIDDVVLTGDVDKTIKHAEAVDTAKRDAQKLELDLATAQNATNAVVGDCAPERDR